MSKLAEVGLNLGAKAQMAAWRAQSRARRFGKDESGMEMIAVVIIVVIVVALGLVFRDRISEFFNNLWDQISGKEGEFSNIS
jgi:Flp pilus assembly pilin Flp